MHELEAEDVGALSEAAQRAGALAGVVAVGARVAIDQGAVEGAIDEDGELAGGGGDGLGLADADGQAPVEGTEGGLAAAAAHDGEAEHGGGAIWPRVGSWR